MGERRRNARPGTANCCGAGSPSTAPGPTPSGWCTPTCAWPTCSSTATTITVIDFDDCGFGWYFYDFGTAVSFFEDDPAVPEWQDAWVGGYRTRRPLAAADEDMLRLVRAAAPAAAAGLDGLPQPLPGIPGHLRSPTPQGSCELAERYLSSDGRRLT